MKIPLDKQLHFLGSALLMCMGYLLFNSIVLAFLLSLSLGVLKELVWDLWMKKGEPDIYDVVYNIIGVVLASTFIATTKGFL